MLCVTYLYIYLLTLSINGRFNAAYAVLADEVNCLKNLKRKYYARKTVKRFGRNERA